MKKSIINTSVLVGLFALVLLAMAGGLRAADLPEQWTKDYDAALAKASESGKPVLAVFSTSWCGPCQHMVNNVYPEEKVINALNEWVPVYVDGDEHRDLVAKHGVAAYPTYVLMDSKGSEIGRMVGGAGDAEGFLDRVDQAVEDGKTIVAVREKIEADPRNPALHRELGLALLESNEAAAMEHLKTALTIEPTATGDIPEQLVETIFDEIRFDKELETINAKLEANPDDAAMYKARGDLYATDDQIMGSGMGRVEKGVEDYKKAVELDPENKTGAATEVAFFNLLMDSPDDPADFITALDTFVADNPKSHRVPLATFINALITVQAASPEQGIEKLQAFRAAYPDHDLAEQAGMMLQGMGVTLESVETASASADDAVIAADEQAKVPSGGVPGP